MALSRSICCSGSLNRRLLLAGRTETESCFLTPSLPSFTTRVSSFSSSPSDKPEEKEENVSVFKRFKNAYQEYGKLLVAVHAATSCVWYGSFYYACLTGVDVVALLQAMGASEVVTRPFQASGLGNFAAAYLLYKLATPARYTVTILGTRYSANVLRSRGFMAPVPPGDNIKSLMKDTKGAVRDKYDNFKDDVKEKMDDMKTEVKEKVKDRASDMREEVSDKIKSRFKNR